MMGRESELDSCACRSLPGLQHVWHSAHNHKHTLLSMVLDLVAVLLPVTPAQGRCHTRVALSVPHTGSLLRQLPHRLPRDHECSPAAPSGKALPF